MVFAVLRDAEVSIHPLHQSKGYHNSLDDRRCIATTVHPFGSERLRVNRKSRRAEFLNFRPLPT